VGLGGDYRKKGGGGKKFEGRGYIEVIWETQVFEEKKNKQRKKKRILETEKKK